jgi:transposase
MGCLTGKSKDGAMKKVFVVRLANEERLELEALVRKGKVSALKVTRARILLKADQSDRGEAWTDAEIAEALDVAPKTVFNIRRRWVEEGLDAALSRKKQERPHACSARDLRLPSLTCAMDFDRAF